MNKSKKKPKKKKFDREKDPEYIKLQDKINKNSSSIWSPSSIQFEKINSNSWFDIQYYKEHNVPYSGSIKETKLPEKSVKCLIVDMKLTPKQKTIFKRWMLTYGLMYNETLRKIKYIYETTNEYILNFQRIRTDHLKTIKNTLILNSNVPDIEGDTQIKAHMLDGAIRLACANYKSALTNYKCGYIKKFRIRYWRINRPSYIIDIEPSYFKKNSICPKIFGDIKCLYNNKIFNLDDISTKYKSECKVQYNKLTNKFNLIVPIKENIIKEDKEQKVVSIDLGLRTFMTCMSESEVIKIGNNVYDELKPYMSKIDKLHNNKNNSQKLTNKEKKIENRCYLNMKNKVIDLHWKSIKFLTSRYKHILIGDLSIKGVSQKDVSVLGKLMKRIGYQLSFFRLRQRLEYKSISSGINYSLVNERYTSKTCSQCGYYDEELGNSKVFNCSRCQMKMDRDVNGCRGIYLKCTI